MPKLAILDFNQQLKRDGVPTTAPGMDMDLVRDCIHCGLCLPKCPTFRVLHHEGDSPRGRMWQIKEASLGLTAFDDPRFQAHIYQCFNCRACETACPSGVQFGSVMGMALPGDARHAAIGAAAPNWRVEDHAAGEICRLSPGG